MTVYGPMNCGSSFVASLCALVSMRGRMFLVLRSTWSPFLKSGSGRLVLFFVCACATLDWSRLSRMLVRVVFISSRVWCAAGLSDAEGFGMFRGFQPNIAKKGEYLVDLLMALLMANSAMVRIGFHLFCCLPRYVRMT